MTGEKQVFENGIHDIPNEVYHASAGLSRSALWTFKELPDKYWYKYLSGNYVRPKETEAFLIGNVVHTMVLEPDLFDAQYFVTAKVNRTTKVGKALWAEAIENAGERTILYSEQYKQCLEMFESVMANETAAKALSGSVAEQSIYWTHEPTGIQCKARPDSLRDGLAIDLKTSLDASPRVFQLDSVKSGYLVQAAMINEACKAVGKPIQRFIFVVVEKHPPYSTAVYILDDEAMDFGTKMFHSLMARYKVCLDDCEWPGYETQILSAPQWAIKELEE